MIEDLRTESGQKIVMASGGFDPIHPGHIGYLREAATLGKLIVIVNGDGFLLRKKGFRFMSLIDRCTIIAEFPYVSCVVGFDDESQDVRRALDILLPDIFAKGGDRTDETNIPEWDICRDQRIEIYTGVGPEKLWSSSKIAKNSQ